MKPRGVGEDSSSESKDDDGSAGSAHREEEEGEDEFTLVGVSESDGKGAGIAQSSSSVMDVSASVGMLYAGCYDYDQGSLQVTRDRYHRRRMVTRETWDCRHGGVVTVYG